MISSSQGAFISKSVASFVKAIGIEMEAMKSVLGSFEVALHSGQTISSEDGRNLYRFSTVRSDEKLVAGIECTLRAKGSEHLVTISSVHERIVQLESRTEISNPREDYVLVIYPWFLYERLMQAIERIPNDAAFYPESALRVFGQKEPSISHITDELEIPGLNASQEAAVKLCIASDVAYIWGPPGTGKTTTLAEILFELSPEARRILVVSTTNAAVDQVLQKIASNERLAQMLERGDIIRLGRVSPEAAYASPEAVMKRGNAAIRDEIRMYDAAASEIRHKLSLIESGREQLGLGDAQLDLFSEVAPVAADGKLICAIFDDNETIAEFLSGDAANQQELFDNALQRNHEKLSEYVAAIEKLRWRLTNKHDQLIDNARILLSTMANVYVNPKLAGKTFDVVIIEEAGMAVLPAVFYCSALAARKVVLIGDPMQLPPIVQSKADYVYRAMGRNIYSVAVPELAESNAVAMLKTQYRMHPQIGEMVSALFYHGALINDDSVDERVHIAGLEPFPGSAMALISTSGIAECRTERTSYSRVNEPHARICVELALQAVNAGVPSIAIITPYVAQSKIIRKLLASVEVEPDRIECKTVHRFQGNERDMVILDTVDSGSHKPGVLLADGNDQSAATNLLNVSVSRAKGKLVVVADTAFFSRHLECTTVASVLKMVGDVCTSYPGS